MAKQSGIPTAVEPETLRTVMVQLEGVNQIISSCVDRAEGVMTRLPAQMGGATAGEGTDNTTVLGLLSYMDQRIAYLHEMLMEIGKVV